RPLAEAIVKGRERIVLVSGIGDPGFAADIVDQLAASCVRAGLGVATIDAASGRPSANPGLGDLLVGAASYGDVVHTDQAGQMARVPWGRQDRLDTHSSHAVTLAEALSDIYHVVLIAAGAPGAAADLRAFAGTDGYLVIASTLSVDEESAADLEADVAALGFTRLQVVGVDDDAQVA
ncbi:MAG: hypothetical protein KKH72_09555, partial [Alphaproteobacteria bacterium]|nr:hypothetical protein [Alphaproteobacteria bacterium]